jgi:hypothetical protein
MEDILMTIPSWCDDCETWHQEHIWAYDDGSYSSSDSDGNHDPLDAEDVPSQEEHDSLWREYSQCEFFTPKEKVDLQAEYDRFTILSGKVHELTARSAQE